MYSPTPNSQDTYPRCLALHPKATFGVQGEPR